MASGHGFRALCCGQGRSGDSTSWPACLPLQATGYMMALHRLH
jgi:hypothetical protein